jgi:superfamily II DNA or RNA helicase
MPAVETTDKLVFALSRMGANSLSGLLGTQTTELLGQLNLVRMTPTALAELLVAKEGVEGILLNRSIRGMLFSAMSEKDGNELLEALGCKASLNPLRDLQEISFTSSSASATKLFKYFECQNYNDRDSKSDLPTIELKPNYPLFKHQRIALLKAINILTTAETPRVLLHMPTGAGKTRTAMNIVANHLRSNANDTGLVIWLAHSEELCDQAAEEFSKAWTILGDRELNLYQNFGSKRVDSLSSIENGFLVAGISLFYNQSISRASEFLKLARKSTLIVMDEAHQSVAPTYQHLLNLLSPTGATPLLGLSATPGRSFINAGNDLKLAKFFNNQKVSLQIDGYDNPVKYLQDEGYLAVVETKKILIKKDESIKITANELKQIEQGFEIPSTVLQRLGEDNIRNLRILNMIIQEASSGKKIIVFACSVAHAELLSDVLRLKGLKAASITSKTPNLTREERISKYRSGDDIQILTNYGVLTTGFDAPKTNVAFICRPTNSVVLYSQMVGRAARGIRAGGNEKCTVYTVVDNIPGVDDVADAFTFWDDIWK